MKPGRSLLAALALGLLAGPAAADSQPLFRIERSKNANVVQYDGRVRADGSLDPDDPIDAYWLRLAKDGRRKELKWTQLPAYGFSTAWQDEGRTLEIKMRAPIGRRVFVTRDGDVWRAYTRIDGRDAWIDRIFIESREGLLLPTVVHIDFEGTDVATGEKRTERFVPD